MGVFGLGGFSREFRGIGVRFMHMDFTEFGEYGGISELSEWKNDTL
jgi:hypothetical protein